MAVYAITLCFTRPEIVRTSLEQFYKTATLKDVKHILLNQHYPLPSHQKVREELEQIAKDFNCVLMDAGKNLGLHHGFNHVTSNLSLNPDDIIIGYDHDSYPTTNGWDEALVTTMNSKSTIGWVSLHVDKTFSEVVGAPLEPGLAGNIRYFRFYKPVTNSICALRWKFLNDVGGLQEPTNFYGHLESAMWQKLQQQKMYWVFLWDYHEGHNPNLIHDRHYTHYKHAHAHSKEWAGDFESFLKEYYPDLKF